MNSWPVHHVQTAEDLERAIMNSRACRQALFMRYLPFPLMLVLVPFFGQISSVFLTLLLRYLVFPPTPVPSALDADVENTAIPLSLSLDSDHPPPYQATSDSAPEPEPKPQFQEPKKPRTSAELFVRGSLILLALVILFIILALNITAMTYCIDTEPLPAPIQAFFWTIFTCCALWAATGVASWAILLRNLWGPKVRARWPIDQNLWVGRIPFRAIGRGLAWPFVVLGGVLSVIFVVGVYGKMVNCIERWQERLGAEDTKGDLEMEGVVDKIFEEDGHESQELLVHNSRVT